MNDAAMGGEGMAVVVIDAAAVEVPKDVGGAGEGSVGGAASVADADEMVIGRPDAAATAERSTAATCCYTAAAAAGVAARICTCTASAPSSRRRAASRTLSTCTCHAGRPSDVAMAEPRLESMVGVKALAGNSLVICSDTTTDGAGSTAKACDAAVLATARESPTTAHVIAVTVALVRSRTVALDWRAARASQVSRAPADAE